MAATLWPVQSSAQNVCTRQNGELYCRNADGTWLPSGDSDQSTQPKKPDATNDAAPAESPTDAEREAVSAQIGCTQTSEDRFDCETQLGHFQACDREHIPRGSPQLMTVRCDRVSDGVSVLVDIRTGEITTDVRFEPSVSGGGSVADGNAIDQSPSESVQSAPAASEVTSLSNAGLAAVVLIALLICVAAVGLIYLFFLPTVICFRRRSGNRWSMFVLNVFLGWTVVAWAILLAWSLSGAKSRGSEGAA
ncbi:MAG: superinfection immunity protein [Hyphomonadaceae bacterium]|nr:superinfection immunity protein [Hyphomonadaceae bacterium]